MELIPDPDPRFIPSEPFRSEAISSVVGVHMGCSVLRNEFVLVPSQGFLVILCAFPQEHNIESDNVTLCP